MLKDLDAQPILAVSDLARARRFYGETLGLEEEGGDAPEGQAMTAYRTGATRLTLYVSDAAGTNEANALVWPVAGGIEEIVADLRAKGVTFERYDFPETTYEDGVHKSGDARMVWFRDPDGNILHLIQGM
ncbi:MAG TPA: VOC family protein [Brevundimonas sp.]|jgi:catechol 2,3-dioxygenase-like lactoylglutathione lyase family enzyme|uniref:VOC family protein n=1 Tax=Brevundimonas sp. TaxID=1871086 RepID=UPI002DE29620|nr:VOC family protein [Brevundimonas sp.]